MRLISPTLASIETLPLASNKERQVRPSLRPILSFLGIGLLLSPPFAVGMETTPPIPPKEVRFSVAQLSSPLSQVSGILLKPTEPKRVLVLTVFHFLRKSFPGETLSPGKTLEEAVQWMDPHSPSETGQLAPLAHSARLVKSHEALDLALLEISIEDSCPYPITATLASEAELGRLKYYDPVWSVGFPMFNPVGGYLAGGSIVSEKTSFSYRLPERVFSPFGVITSLSDSPFELWTTDARSAPGSSGGGIFAVKTQKVIGMQFAISQDTSLFISGHVLNRFMQ